MDANFSSSKCNLTLFFNPDETSDAALCMQLLFEEGKRKGYNVPLFEKDFFRKFAASRESIGLVFEFDDLGFAASFIGEVIDSTYKYNGNSENVETLIQFLNELEQWCPEYHTIH